MSANPETTATQAPRPATPSKIGCRPVALSSDSQSLLGKRDQLAWVSAGHPERGRHYDGICCYAIYYADNCYYA